MIRASPAVFPLGGSAATFATGSLQVSDRVRITRCPISDQTAPKLSFMLSFTFPAIYDFYKKIRFLATGAPAKLTVSLSLTVPAMFTAVPGMIVTRCHSHTSGKLSVLASFTFILFTYLTNKIIGNPLLVLIGEIRDLYRCP